MIYNAEYIKARHAEMIAEASRVRLAKAARKHARANSGR